MDDWRRGGFRGAAATAGADLAFSADCVREIARELGCSRNTVRREVAG
jgi:hypothetical protein